MQEHIPPPYFKVNHPQPYAPNQPPFVADEDDILDDLFLEGEPDESAHWTPSFEAKSAANSL
jgi:hypothetical protein